MIDPPRDLALIVLTPLLLLPLASSLRLFVSAEAIYLAVMTFGNMGHHLPGMIRAYGDRPLFERFRARFVAIPLLLFAASLYLAFVDLSALTFMVGAWGLWHGLAQVYGFARIYDARVGASSLTGAHLDRAMCLAWFLGGVVFSDYRMLSFLELFWQTGGPPVLASWVETLRDVFGAGMAAVTMAWCGFAVWQHRRGRPPSPVKLVFMISSFAFWWYCMVEISEVLLGLALFEIVHDTQYLAIVWIYNRKRASQGDGLRSFARYLFQGRRVLLLVYVGLVFAYGSLGLLGRELAGAGIVPPLMNALIAFSAFFHFYTDSFIWSVRDPETRSTLGLPGADRGRPAWRGTGRLGHAARWAWFVAPIAVMSWWAGGQEADLFRWQEARRAFPTAAAASVGLGEQLLLAGRPAEAQAEFEHALGLEPGLARARSGQGYAALDRGDLRAARVAFEEATRLEPALTNAWLGLAKLHLVSGDAGAAHEAARRARALEPGAPETERVWTAVRGARARADERSPIDVR